MQHTLYFTHSDYDTHVKMSFYSLGAFLCEIDESYQASSKVDCKYSLLHSNKAMKNKQKIWRI